MIPPATLAHRRACSTTMQVSLLLCVREREVGRVIGTGREGHWDRHDQDRQSDRASEQEIVRALVCHGVSMCVQCLFSQSLPSTPRTLTTSLLIAVFTAWTDTTNMDNIRGADITDHVRPPALPHFCQHFKSYTVRSLFLLHILRGADIDTHTYIHSHVAVGCGVAGDHPGKHADQQRAWRPHCAQQHRLR